jgi:hypothetical protein
LIHADQQQDGACRHDDRPGIVFEGRQLHRLSRISSGSLAMLAAFRMRSITGNFSAE